MPLLAMPARHLGIGLCTCRLPRAILQSSGKTVRSSTAWYLTSSWPPSWILCAMPVASS